MIFDDSQFKFKNLHPYVRYLVYAALAILILINIFMIGSAITAMGDPENGVGFFELLPGVLLIFTFTAIAFVIAYYVCGKTCWVLAYNKDRNTDFAFAWGFFSGILGTFFYWIYTLFLKKNPDNWELDTEKVN
jgi:hypothetical protein